MKIETETVVTLTLSLEEAKKILKLVGVQPSNTSDAYDLYCQLADALEDL